MRESDYHRSAYVRMCQKRNNDRKELITKIKKTNRELAFYEWHADMISENMSKPRADDHKRRTTAPTRNYLNGLLSAYELIYGKDKELQDLREYLLQRRVRVHQFLTAARRLYWERKGGQHEN